MGFQKMFEQNFNNLPAERRKKKAEEKEELSISHYKGNLHGHSR